MMTIAVDALTAGDCLYARTPTAEYWIVMLGNLVASVYRKGNDQDHAILLEKRRMSNRITQDAAFMMYNQDNQPVSCILPLEVKKVPATSIPLRGE